MDLKQPDFQYQQDPEQSFMDATREYLQLNSNPSLSQKEKKRIEHWYNTVVAYCYINTILSDFLKDPNYFNSVKSVIDTLNYGQLATLLHQMNTAKNIEEKRDLANSLFAMGVFNQHERKNNATVLIRNLAIIGAVLGIAVGAYSNRNIRPLTAITAAPIAIAVVSESKRKKEKSNALREQKSFYANFPKPFIKYLRLKAALFEGRT